MKSSDVQKEQDRSDFNRNRRSRRLGLIETERKCQILEVQRKKRPWRPYIDDAARVLRSSKRAAEPSRPTTNIPLPPISKSRTVPGKVESARPQGCITDLPTGNKMKENAAFGVFVTRRGTANQESNKHPKISAAPAARNREAETGKTCSRLIKQPNAAPENLTQREARGFCSDDSAAETESEDCEERRHPEWLEEGSDDEYYTDQRITEWVLRVNSSLFSTGNNDRRSLKPADEQDVATIKIIYSEN